MKPHNDAWIEYIRIYILNYQAYNLYVTTIEHDNKFTTMMHDVVNNIVCV